MSVSIKKKKQRIASCLSSDNILRGNVDNVAAYALRSIQDRVEVLELIKLVDILSLDFREVNSAGRQGIDELSARLRVCIEAPFPYPRRTPLPTL